VEVRRAAPWRTEEDDVDHAAVGVSALWGKVGTDERGIVGEDEFNVIRNAVDCSIVSGESESRRGVVEGDDWCNYRKKKPGIIDQWMGGQASHAPRSQVFAKAIAFPPTPQNASSIVSHRHRSAICVAIASGVTLYQPSSSSRQPCV